MADEGKGDRIGDPRDKDTRVRDYEEGHGRERGSIGTGDRGEDTERRGVAGEDTRRRGVAGGDTGRRAGAATGRGSRRRLWLGVLALLIILGGIALISAAGVLNQPQGPAPATQGPQGQSPPPPNQQAAGEPNSNGQNHSNSSNHSTNMKTTS